MTKDTVINGKPVLLTDREMAKAAKFHKERLAFAIFGNVVVFNEDPSDDRDHLHWLAEDFRVDSEWFEELIRGYVSMGKIYLYRGTHFSGVPASAITSKHLNQLLSTHDNYFGRVDTDIYSGMVVGKVGEIWKPIKKIMSFPKSVRYVHD